MVAGSGRKELSLRRPRVAGKDEPRLEEAARLGLDRERPRKGVTARTPTWQRCDGGGGGDDGGMMVVW